MWRQIQYVQIFNKTSNLLLFELKIALLTIIYQVKIFTLKYFKELYRNILPKIKYL
jgi:hypothetical protein